jgi:prepilin-type processing-associated H-X9-DG protein
VTSLFDSPAVPLTRRVSLSDPGQNRNGRLIRALAIDTQFLCPPTLAEFNVKPRTHHKEKFANILFSGGHVVSCTNDDGRFTVDLRDYSELRDAFNKILEVLERADEEH